MNQERELLHQNTRLKKGKRLSDEIVLRYPAFKRRKLTKVGDRSIFDTDRKRYEYEVETEDICTKQPLYSINLSVNIAV